MLFSRTKTNAVFYRDELERLFADEPQRYSRAVGDPTSVDALTWNVFASLDTHSDPDWLAHRLTSLGGHQVRAPIRLSLWTGRVRHPLLQPSPAYVAWVRDRSTQAGADPQAVAAFERPIEVPVRIESPDVLVLVDTMLGAAPRGSGGRERLLELVDAGLEHARRLSKALAVGVVYQSGTPAAGELSARINQLRHSASLARALPHRTSLPPVLFREIGWQQLLRMWETEIRYLRLGGQPVRAFLDQARQHGLR